MHPTPGGWKQPSPQGSQAFAAAMYCHFLGETSINTAPSQHHRVVECLEVKQGLAA